MQNIPDCPRGKGFFPVSYQVSTQDIWINDICSVKPRIRMWPWSSIMHSYHMVNNIDSILPGRKSFLFLMQKSGKSDFIVTVSTLKNALLWYFRNGIFHDDTFRSIVKYYTHQKSELIFTSILKSIFMCLVHFRLDFDILSEPFIEHLLLILLNLNHILLFTH